MKEDPEKLSSKEPQEGKSRAMEKPEKLCSREQQEQELRTEDAKGPSSKKVQQTNADVLKLKTRKCGLNMPLLYFRISYFLWSGAGGVPMVFLPLYLNQHGISVEQFSAILAFGSVLSFIGPVISGAVADKTGHTKPVLIFNLICHAGVLVMMLLLVQAHIPAKHTLYDTSWNSSFICFNDTISNTEKFPLDCHLSCSEHLTIVSRGNDSVEDSYAVDEASDVPKNSSKCFSLHSNGNISMSCGEIVTIICKDGANQSNSNIILVIYAILVVLHSTTTTTLYRCFDVSILIMVKEHNTGVGLEYAFHTISEVVFRFAAGFIVYIYSERESLNYDLTLWFTVFLDGTILISIWKLKVHMDKQKLDMWKSALKLFGNVDLVVLFAIAFTLGASFGLRSNFSLWFLEYLHAPGIMFAFHPATVSLYQVPMFFISDWLMTKLQPSYVYIASFLLYSANQIGYALAQDPWWTLLFEITTIVNAGLMFVALLQSCSKFAPKGLLSTVTSAAGSMHTGVGSGAGAVIGGILISRFGPRMAFMNFAAANGAAAVCYSSFLIARKIQTSKYRINMI